MAKTKQTDVLARLADAGEEVLSRLASSSGMDRVTGAVTNLRDQVDTLASKVRGMEKLEKRVEDLERKVERLSKPSGSSSRKTATARKTSASRKTSSEKKA
jgi:polyhydroxyalkanoate synthesis regulator phasin